MAEVAAKLKVDAEVVDDARAIIQTLDPAGVGARDLAECLRLQMHAAGQLEDVAEVCLAHLDLVATKQWQKLAALAGNGCDAEEVQLAVAEIQKCNPKPAAGFETARIDSVVPDVIVLRGEDGGWRVELNGAAFPRLLAFPPMKDKVGGKSGGEAHKFLQERFGRAKWLLNALEQRAKTTLEVGRAVVVAQTQFFEAGVEFLVPLTLRTVAETIGVHESTVSRVVNGKYMQTPWGVLELKYFFASGVASSGGQVSVAATSVQALIGKLVKTEDPRKPLSDEQIVLKLKDEGVEVARRTVAKYREAMNIPSSVIRRRQKRALVDAR
jgi:RNA polymerase sigma-54 factor